MDIKGDAQMEEGLEDMIRRIVEESLVGMRSQSDSLPKAYLIGQKPSCPTGYTYVRDGDYEAVVIGSMSPWELLQFPNEVCTRALATGMPVLLWEDGLEHRRYRDRCNRALYARLLSAERQLKQYGVHSIGQGGKKFLTASDIRQYLDAGKPIEGRLTPLARDILERNGQ